MKNAALLLILSASLPLRGAEISVPGGLLRVDGHSQVRVSGGQVEITRGTVTYELQDAAAVQVEILTPSVTVRSADEGVYRISIRKTGESEITAQSGRMLIVAPAGEQWVEAGQKMIARGPRANPEFRLVSAVSWWRRLAEVLQNVQISGGGGATVESSAVEENTSARPETHSKPQTERSAPAGNVHAAADRPKTSDGHSNPPGGAHSGDSRPTSSGGGHSAPAASAPSAAHTESHSAPPSSSRTDNAPKGK